MKEILEGRDRSISLPCAATPVAQNICFSGWVSMKLIVPSKKEIKEKDPTRWFCVLKQKMLSFYYDDTDCEPQDFCYDCRRICYIGKETKTEENEASSAFYITIQGSQKMQHLRIEVSKDLVHIWLLLIIKEWGGAWVFMSRKRFIYAYENEENYFEYDIRKIICIKSQLSNRSQWCPRILVPSKIGPYLIASEGSALYVQSDYDLVTQCWKEALEHELFAVSNKLEDQRLTTRDVPHLVEKCINFISAYGLNEEGIYRHNGTISKSRELLANFQKDPTSVEIRCEEYSVHDVASTLRYFFRNLEDSIFTRQLKPDFLKLCNLPESDMHKKLSGYEELLLSMELEHRVNYATLRKLFGHLKEVTDNCGVNKMPVSNIAAIFGASLFCDDMVDLTQNMPYGNTAQKICIIGDLITNYYQKTQARSLLIPVHLFEYDNQAFNVQDNKTAEEVCSFAVEHHKLKEEDGPYALFEVVRGGRLERAVFPDEKLITIAINRWQNWTDLDKSGNYLLVKRDYVRRRLESVTPYPFITEVLFADTGSKSFKKAAFQCIKGEVCYYKNSKCTSIVKKWAVENLLWFFGAESKRDAFANRCLTFVEKDRKPCGKFLGMCMQFKDESDLYKCETFEWIAAYYANVQLLFLLYYYSVFII